MSAPARSPPKFATKTSRQAVALPKAAEKTQLGTTTRGSRPDKARGQEHTRMDEWTRQRGLLQRVARGFLGRLRARRLQSQRSHLRNAISRRCLPAIEAALRACQHKTRKFQWAELGQAASLRSELLVLKRDVERQVKRLEEGEGEGTQDDGLLEASAAALLAHSGGMQNQDPADAYADEAPVSDSFEDTLLGARYAGIRRLQAHAAALFEDRHPLHARLSAVEGQWRARVQAVRDVAMAVAEGDTTALQQALAQAQSLRTSEGRGGELRRRLHVAATLSARLLSLLQPCLLAGRFALPPDNGPLHGEALRALSSAAATIDEADTERLAHALRWALEKGGLEEEGRDLTATQAHAKGRQGARPAAARWLLPLCPALRVALAIVCLRRLTGSGDWASLLHELMQAQDEGLGIPIPQPPRQHSPHPATGESLHAEAEGPIFERPVFPVLSWLRQELAVYRGAYASNVLRPLLESVATGGGLGGGGQRIGEVGPEEVQVQPLYEALQRLAGDEGGCGLFLSGFVSQAAVVYELRCAWRRGDWEGVGSAVTQAEVLVRKLEDSGAVCVIREEVIRAGLEVADYQRRQRLTAWIEEEIKAARVLPPRKGMEGPEKEMRAVEGVSEASKRLMAEWGLLETARGLLRKRAWREAYEWLGLRHPGTRLEPVWVWARQRVHYRLTQQRLRGALARGPVGGTAKHVDFSTVDPQRLAKAIAECRKTQRGANAQSQGLIDTAVLVCELRISGRQAQAPSREERRRKAGIGEVSPAAGAQSPNRRAGKGPRMAEREEGEGEEEEEACLMRTWLAVEAVLFRHKARVEALLGALRRAPPTDHIAMGPGGEASPARRAAGGRWEPRSPNVSSPPEAGDDPFGDNPTGGETADPLRVRGEVALLRAFAYFHRARGLLHHSLLSGNPSGLPDNLNLAPVTVGPLSDAVALGDRALAAVLAASPTNAAAEDEKAEDELARLLHWSGAMLRARKSLLSHGWEGALSALEALEGEEGSLPGSPLSPFRALSLPGSPLSPSRGKAGRMEDRAAAVLVNLRAAAAHNLLRKIGREALLLPSSPYLSPSSPASPVSPAESAMALADRYGCRDAEARQLYVTLTCLQRLRTAVTAENTGALAHALRHWDAQPPDNLCPEASTEVQAAQRLLIVLKARDALRATLAAGEGRIGGTVGALDLRGVETRKLREALSTALTLLEEQRDLPPCVSMGATIALARCVIELREGFVARDMGRVEAALRMYYAHCDETERLGIGTSAAPSTPWSHGGSPRTDTFASVNAALVSPVPAESAMPTEEQEGEASAEVALAAAEWFSSTVADRFAAAVSDGGVSGPLGGVDISAIRWRPLQSVATDHARHSQHHALPTQITRLVRAAEALAGLRRAVAEGRDTSELEAWVEQASVHCVDEAGQTYPEVERVRQEAANDAARQRLTEALTTGGLRMRAQGEEAERAEEEEPLEVLIQGVEVGELQVAMATARQLCPRGDDVARLLTLADHVLNLRLALLNGRDWAVVRRSLAELRALGLGPSETRLMHHELGAVEEAEATAALVESLREALSHGAVARGPVPWSLELSDMTTHALDDALARLAEIGERWGPQPPRDLARLAHVAQTVRALRTALAVACDSTATRQARETARGQVQEALSALHPPASSQDVREPDLVSSLQLEPLMAELELVQELVHLWGVERGLSEALRAGQAGYGAHRSAGVDTRQLGLQALGQAIENAQRLPLPPPEPLERLLHVAAAALQLRRAVAAGEWARVRELCNAPRGGEAESREAGEVVLQREVQLARRLAAWRGLADAIRPLSGEPDREADVQRLADAVERVTAVGVNEAGDAEALDWAQRLLHLRRARAENDKSALRVAVAALLPPGTSDLPTHLSNTTGLAGFVLVEARAARDELNYGAAAARLSSALAFGNVSGQPLRLDMTHTQTRALSDALANAQALVAGSLTFNTTTNFTSTGTLTTSASPEQAELRRLVDVASAMLHLRSAIIAPRSDADEDDAASHQRLREALSTALPLLRSDRVPAGGVREEVELLQRHVLCTDLLAECIAAAAAFERPVDPEEESGEGKGRRYYCAANVGEVDVDFSTIDVQPLQRALETAEAAMSEDPHVRQALQPALTRLRRIAQARLALRSGHWAALESAVGALAAESQGQAFGEVASPVVMPHAAGAKGPQAFSLTRELGMFNVQLHVRRPLSDLSEALASGGAQILPGVVDVTTVETVGLEKALTALRAVATGAGEGRAYGRFMTQRARQTVDTAVALGACVLDIRIALLRHDYTAALRLTRAALAEHRDGKREEKQEGWMGLECVDKELRGYVAGLQQTLRFNHLSQCLTTAAAAGEEAKPQDGPSTEAELDFLVHLAFGEGLPSSSDLGHVAALRRAAAALRRRRVAGGTLQRLATDMQRSVLDLSVLQQVVHDWKGGQLGQTAPQMAVVRDWLVALTSHESRLRAAVVSLKPQALHDAHRAFRAKMQRWTVKGEGLNLWLVALSWPSLIRAQVLLASAEIPARDLPQLLVTAAALMPDPERPSYADACRAAGLKPLSHCPVPIGNPLTALEPDLASIAKRAFAEKVLALESPPSEALEASWDIVRLGERLPPLRDELLCQLIMQLQGRMDDGGARTLWDTLARCLRAFSPSRALSPVVEAFAHAHRRTDLLGLLYVAALGPIGDPQGPPGSNKSLAEHPEVAALRSLLEAPLPTEAELLDAPADENGATAGPERTEPLEAALMRVFPDGAATRASLAFALQDGPSGDGSLEHATPFDADMILRPLLALKKAEGGGGDQALGGKVEEGKGLRPEELWDAVIVPHCDSNDGFELDAIPLQDLARLVRLGRFEEGLRERVEGAR